jgi:hypothetical protein
MFRRIGPVDAAAEHGDCPSSRLQRALVRRSVDAPSEAADHRQPRLGQPAAQLFGRQTAGRCRMARADDGHGVVILLAERPAHGEQRRRIVDRLQAGRIILIENRQDTDRQPFKCLEFPIDGLQVFGAGPLADRLRQREADSVNLR